MLIYRLMLTAANRHAMERIQGWCCCCWLFTLWFILRRKCIRRWKMRLQLTMLTLVLQEKVIAALFLFRVLDRVQLIDTRSEIVWISTERNVEQFQETVHASKQILW